MQNIIRLESEASEVQQQIDALVNSCVQIAAAEFRNIEADLARLNRKLTWPRQGMALLKLAGCRKIQEQSAKMAKSQPKTIHSHGAHPKTVQLTGGVTVILNNDYYQRIVHPEKAKNKKVTRGMYPMLILLGIADGFTAGVR